MNPSYDNSFGSFGTSGAGFGMSASGAVSSGSGDMTLEAKPEKKAKKWLVVLLAFLVVGALVAGLIYLTTSRLNDGSSSGAKNYQEAFNVYANYYMYGEDKTDEMTAEYSADEGSYFNEVMDSDEVSSEYLDNLMSYYTTFLTMYKESVDDGDDLEVLDLYGAELKLLTVYLKDDFITRSDIMDEYLSSGEVAANDLIEAKLAPYKDLGEIGNRDFYEYALNWGKQILKLIEKYDELGCVEDGNLSYVCVYENENEEVEGISDAAAENYYYVKWILDASKTDLYSLVFGINEIINTE